MELIDRNALWEKIFSYPFGWSNEDVVSELKTAATVDAVLVVHGEWILSSTIMQCSICKTSYDIDMYSPVCIENAYYCPNCGAKMERGKR